MLSMPMKVSGVLMCCSCCKVNVYCACVQILVCLDFAYSLLLCPMSVKHPISHTTNSSVHLHHFQNSVHLPPKYRASSLPVMLAKCPAHMCLKPNSLIYTQGISCLLFQLVGFPLILFCHLSNNPNLMTVTLDSTIRSL